jgi:uncharacterized RDD family membrane protein YckC
MNTRVLDGEILTTGLDDARLYEGVRTRRIVAVVIDYLIVALLTIPVAILVFLLGLLTLGLGWVLFSVLVPVVALTYVWFTLGSSDQATTGMKLLGVRLERLDGRPVDGVLAVVHSVLFWAGNVILTPLVLLVSLFADRKRTLHDLLLGTVVRRSYR